MRRGCGGSPSRDPTKRTRGSVGMKRLLGVAGLALGLVIASVPQSEANSLLTIDVSGTTLTCNNSTAAGVAACTAAGFVTALGSNAITFTGLVNGVQLGGGGLTGVQ